MNVYIILYKYCSNPVLQFVTESVKVAPCFLIGWRSETRRVEGVIRLYFLL